MVQHVSTMLGLKLFSSCHICELVHCDYCNTPFELASNRKG
jgi:hypothetical protein